LTLDALFAAKAQVPSHRELAARNKYISHHPSLRALEAPFSAVGRLGRERLTRFIGNAAPRICLKF
jgi:hypothetical protein